MGFFDMSKYRMGTNGRKNIKGQMLGGKNSP